VDDFRGISISPVISKLFELAILDRFSDYFESSDSQFGFKKDLSCRHVIYSVRSVIERYISNGSTVNICALDLSKAYDRTNKYALLMRLMERKLPVKLLSIFEDWLNKSETCVRWGGLTSHFFKLRAGVRQGGVLSPFFAIYLDRIVADIKAAHVGCHIGSICVSVFLYADDILLLSPSVTGLQTLLTICENVLSDLDMRLNEKKSVCMRFGARFNVPCANITSTHGGQLQWVSCCRYLGVYFTSGRQFRCSFDKAKSGFYRAFNSILSKVGRFASEEVVVNLLVSKCLPCLLYGVEACPFLVRNKSSFDFLFTRTFMKLFRTGSPAIVKQCQVQFGVLPLHFQVDIRTAKFLEAFVVSPNPICSVFKQQASGQLHNLFGYYGEHVRSSFDIRAKATELFAETV
jgi:hypothetical protein